MAGNVTGMVFRLLTEYRRQTIIALSCVVAAVVIGGGAYVLYDLLISPSAPDVTVAEAPEVAAFMAHARGFVRLPAAERRRFFGEMMRRYREPSRRRELVTYLDTLSTQEKLQLREAVFVVVQDEFFEDLERFHQTPETRRDEFVDESLVGLVGFVAEMKGAGRDTDLTRGMGQGLPMTPNDINKFVAGRTRASDLARAQPFVEAIERRIEELDRSSRARAEFERKMRQLQARKVEQEG
ncbi:MAG TPA: hypothetical protein VMZ31_11265 [Phycisphaerae bacterium]|nr:hypothetical protein [Phycisphaerae bacterium]